MSSRPSQAHSLVRCSQMALPGSGAMVHCTAGAAWARAGTLPSEWLFRWLLLLVNTRHYFLNIFDPNIFVETVDSMYIYFSGLSRPVGGKPPSPGIILPC